MRRRRVNRPSRSELLFYLVVVQVFALWSALACLEPRERQVIERSATPRTPWSIRKHAHC